MSTYRIDATRWAQGWELHFDGVGVTQTASLATAFGDAGDYLDLIVGPQQRDLIIQVTVEPPNPARRRW